MQESPTDKRYLVTLVVNTPEGERQASRVVRVRSRMVHSAIQGDVVFGKFQGQAVPVDLPNGKTLFLTYDIRGTVEYELSLPWKGTDQVIDGNKVHVVSPDAYPLIVFFKDLSKPESVTEVPPGTEEEKLGKGYRIRSIFVSRTDRDLDGDIVTIIPWIKNLSTNLSGRRITKTNDIDDVLNRSSFLN